MQNWILVFHLFGLVLWGGSLLALTRLMAWRAQQSPEVAGTTGALEKKLMFGGAHAGMGLSLLTGVWMLLQQEWGPIIPSVSGGGFHIKLTFVVALIVVTFIVQTKVIAHAAGRAGGSVAMLGKLYGAVIALVLGALISVYVLYPQMKAKKAAAAADTSAAVQTESGEGAKPTE